MDLDLTSRKGLPEALRVLLAEFPRPDWEAHANFTGLVQFWMERHVMFRRLTEALREDAEAAVDGRLDPVQHGARLGRLGSMLVQQLHGHHQIEDHHYFPQLIGMERRLSRGFDVLDKDHHALDGLLGRFTEKANAVLQGQGEAGVFHAELVSFEGLLHRHLEDEEDLIVPVLLKHGTGGLH
ncbi:MAG: hemerythrin domain-containing protein [Paracoccaceae bacterium]|nr:hemerythrin domain-containing protein [Paracoccaceae bacterium]